MIVGSPPFYPCSTLSQLYSRILSPTPDPIPLPSPYNTIISSEAIHLVSRLLQRNPQQRLSFPELKENPYLDLTQSERGWHIIKTAIGRDKRFLETGGYSKSMTGDNTSSKEISQLQEMKSIIQLYVHGIEMILAGSCGAIVPDVKTYIERAETLQEEMKGIQSRVGIESSDDIMITTTTTPSSTTTSSSSHSSSSDTGWSTSLLSGLWSILFGGNSTSSSSSYNKKLSDELLPPTSFAVGQSVSKSSPPLPSSSFPSSSSSSSPSTSTTTSSSTITSVIFNKKYKESMYYFSRAIAFEKQQNFSSALDLYNRGLSILIDLLKSISLNSDISIHHENLKQEIEIWFQRAEQCKSRLKSSLSSDDDTISLINPSSISSISSSPPLSQPYPPQQQQQKLAQQQMNWNTGTDRKINLSYINSHETVFAEGGKPQLEESTGPKINIIYNNNNRITQKNINEEGIDIRFYSLFSSISLHHLLTQIMMYLLILFLLFIPLLKFI